jgi:class 3 adenylate cyclase
VVDSQGNLWKACYIPGERGRILLTGIDSKRYFQRFRIAELLLHGLFCSVYFAGAWFLYGSARGTGWTQWNLWAKLLLLFLMTSAFPLLAVFLLGSDRESDTAKINRRRWEHRLTAVAGTMDLAYEQFQLETAVTMETLEGRLAQALPQAATSRDLQPLLAEYANNFSRIQLLLLTSNGLEGFLDKGMGKTLLSQSEYQSLFKKYLVRAMKREGRQDFPMKFDQALQFLSEEQSERFLRDFDQGFGKWVRWRSASRQILQRFALVRDQTGKTAALLIQNLDENSLAQPFVENWTASTFSRNSRAIRLVALGDDGKIWPAFFQLPPAIIHMLDRVGTFHGSEFSRTLLQGADSLVLAARPERLGGYRLVAFVPVAVMQEGQQFIRLLILVSTGFGLAFLGFSVLLLTRGLVSRVEDLRSFVDRIGLGEYAARTPVPVRDELGMVAETLNRMAGDLEKREQLKGFVSEQVWEETRKDDEQSLALGGKRCEAAVLFSHIHGFDPLVEALPEAVILELLSLYFPRMDAIIREHQGTIDKFIGDAVMAVFFPLPEAPHPAERAVRAAAAMVAASPIIGTSFREKGVAEWRTDAGVHFGTLISGKVGSKSGFRNFTVIGDVVNTSARLSAKAAEQPRAAVLFTEEVRGFCPETLAVEKIGSLPLKGKKEPTAIFGLKNSHE